MTAATNLQVREHNQNLVRRELLRVRRATKAQLAAATGLSQMTVGTVVSALLESGEVERGEALPSAGGRPSAEYGYRGGYRKILVAYSYQKQRRNFVRLQVHDMFGACVFRDSAILETVEEDSFDRLLARAFENVEGIGAVGLGLPGQVVDGEIVANDHPALVGKRILRRFEALYRVPVLFVNDVNAAAWGCRLRSGNTEGETLAALYFPERYPPGMGLVVEGRLHTGHRSFAGELQYLPIGVDWTALDYREEEVVSQAVSKLLAAICSLTAPDRLVLYGEFLRPGQEEGIRRLTEERLGGGYGVRLETCPSLESDYQAGMLALTQQSLKRALFGEAWDE